MRSATRRRRQSRRPEAGSGAGRRAQGLVRPPVKLALITRFVQSSKIFSVPVSFPPAEKCPDHVVLWPCSGVPVRGE